MTLRPTFERLFSEGVVGGQCASFAHKLIEFPLVGDFLSQKVAAVKKYGIVKEKIKEFKPGDVLVTNESKTNGHVAVINNVWGGYLGLTESNFKLDKKVHHTRQIKANSSAIIGIIRGAFKFTPMPLQMKVKVLSNVSWNSAQHLNEARNFLKEWSGVDAVFDVQQTNFIDIPLAPLEGVQTVDINWYRENITAPGYDATILLLPYEQWPGLVSGMMMYQDPGKPVRIVVSGQEHEPLPEGIETVSKRIIHEIGHAFGYLTNFPNQTSVLHEYEGNHNLAGFFKLINYQALSEKLGQGETMNGFTSTIKERESKKRVGVILWADSLDNFRYLCKVAGIVPEIDSQNNIKTEFTV